MKSILRRASALLFAFVFVFVLASCEVEMEPATATMIVTSAEAIVWTDSASSEDDIEESSLLVAELENGTGENRFVKISMEMNTTNYVGYQWLYCDFVLTSDTDAKLTLEMFVRKGENGEAKSQGQSSYTLTAGEATEMSLPVELDFRTYVEEDVFVDIVFISTLPFTSTEGDSAEESIDLTSWAEITYEISDVCFYGAQTVAR